MFFHKFCNFFYYNFFYWTPGDWFNTLREDNISFNIVREYGIVSIA